MTFSICPCLPEHLPGIAAIYAHWVRTGVASFEIEPPGVDDLARRRDAVLEKRLPYLVAIETASGEVAGYAYASQYRPREAYRFTVEDSVYIAPRFAGQGLGRRLLGDVIDASAAAGYKQMIAVIGGGLENAASVKLHEALGFMHTGVLHAVGFKFERWVDTALMQRAL